MMLLEQLSVRKERALLVSLADTPSDPNGAPYGVLQKLVAIRDVGTMTLLNFSPHTQAIARRITVLSGDNYPELLAKAYVS